MSAKTAKLDNSPNAGKLLDSLRYLGYDNLYAISDIVDNSIDADAENIRVNITRAPKADFIIQIADDGAGMDEETLDQASRLGSDVPRNQATDLGRFGMGLVTASLSLGRRLTIITRARGGEILTNITDVDHMTEANKFVKEYFGVARDDEVKTYREALGDAPHGTIVQITKCDGFKRKYVKNVEKDLTKHLGQAYRMFIRAGRGFYVNGAEVPVNDPLWLDHEGTEVYSDDSYELKHTDADGNETRDTVRIRLVILPDHGSRAANTKAGYNAQRSGFYVLRNNREIAPAQQLKLESFKRHPSLIRFRGDVFVSGRMDDALGIEFTKRDVKPLQGISDQIDAHVGGSVKSIRKRLEKRETVSGTETLDHSSSERLIDSKAALLIKPSPSTRNTADAGDEEEDKEHATPLGLVRFRRKHFEREGPIYAAEQRGKAIFIDWNIDHPFYERFILANRDNRDAFNAVDAMIYSMAAAELKVFDEDSREFVERWQEIFSSNMKTILS